MQLQVILIVIHMIMALSLVGLILIQHGRGADAGAAFGSGASATVFGARGSATFLVKVTTILAIAFFGNSLALAYLAAKQPQDSSLLEDVQITAPAPAALTEESATTPMTIPADIAPPDAAQLDDAPIIVQDEVTPDMELMDDTPTIPQDVPPEPESSQ